VTREALFFRFPTLFFVRFRNSCAKIYERCAKKWFFRKLAAAALIEEAGS
jgi:hypothetical protein